MGFNNWQVILSNPADVFLSYLYILADALLVIPLTILPDKMSVFAGVPWSTYPLFPLLNVNLCSPVPKVLVGATSTPFSTISAMVLNLANTISSVVLNSAGTLPLAS